MEVDVLTELARVFRISMEIGREIFNLCKA